jgi:type IV pilus assembly protein PilQ
MVILLSRAVCAASADSISMDFQNVNIQDAINTFAQFNQTNVVISPNVRGFISLHLEHVSAEKALDLLLDSHGLSKWQMDNVWFIAPSGEFIQHEQEKIKLNTLLQESSPLMTRIWHIYYAKAEDIAALLQDNNSSFLSKRGHVKVDMRTNVICIQDVKDHIQMIDGLIKRLDIPVQQILIEAHLASIDSDYERELGLHFAGVTNTQSSESNDRGSRYRLAIIPLAKDSFLDVQLAALENEGHGELISSPSLFTANQQAASIESGEEIPYQEISKSGATGVAFKKAVLSLKVTPQIMPGNQVLLQLQVNQDKPSNRMVLGVPAISTRQISTHILVKNGQTIVLGGVYETNKENGEQRIPVLGNIPIIGGLFNLHNTAENKRELLIFVTPKIITV